jgi:hypothetical protein
MKRTIDPGGPTDDDLGIDDFEPVKQYIGDSVYAEFNGWEVILTTDNGYGPSNTIVLDPKTWSLLMEFVARVTKRPEDGA